MKNTLCGLLFYCVLLISACVSAENGKERVIIHGDEMAHPLLISIDIPSDGLLEKEMGRAFVMKDGHGNYEEIIESALVNFDDVIRLDKGTSVNISFGDGSYLRLGPVSQTKWFKFEETEPAK